MKKLLLTICGLAIAAAVEAQIIHVPGDYPTIQQGIEAATNGDTVLVSDGTYYEQINFLGKKPLMVASEFLTDGDTNHIASTIIDGSQLTNLDSASVVYFVSGEDSTSILCGFTVRNGKGTYTTDNYNDRQGGGIWISNAGAKIINNLITHNTVDDTQTGNGASTSGGGIGAKFGIGNFWIVIDHNTIDSNASISQNEYAVGGGIALSYNTRIINNIISHNSARGYQTAQVWGGGMYIVQGAGWPNCMAFIEENAITDNFTQGLVNTCAAGLECDNMKIIFSNNLVAGNIINPSGSGGGSGFLLYQPEEGSIVRNNIFRENVSSVYAGGGMIVQTNSITPNTVLVENNYFINNVAPNGGAFCMLSNPVLLQNNVFIDNQAANIGGALYFLNNLNQQIEHLAILINNSFYNNTATMNGGAIYSTLAKPLIFNSIFWNDDANNGQEIFLASPNDTVEIGFSAIDLNAVQGAGFTIDGSGNINEDPLFTNLELLTISGNSPCVNTGIEEYYCHCDHLHTPPSYDILGNLRPLDGYFDMGAYEKLHGQIIHVPADYPTIQQGIDAAQDSDTVLVAEDTYFENINFDGKAILLASEFILDGDTNHINNTIIDGSQAVNPDIGSVVTFESGEDTTSVLCGFTITGGTGTLESSVSMRMGGGMHIKYSGGKFLNNHIHDNSVSYSGGVYGGGMQLGGPVTEIPWIVLRNNRIYNNEAKSSANSASGGGFFCFYNLIMENNKISHNEANGHLGGDGGGVAIGGAFGLIEVDVHNNEVTYNEAKTDIGTNSYATLGGGMSFYWDVTGNVSNNLISYNSLEAPGAYWSWGPGVFIQDITSDDFVFENNRVNENHAITTQTCRGGGVSLLRSGGKYQNNVIQNNSGSHGGGFSIITSNEVGDTAILINNTITDNEATLGGGIYLMLSKSVILNSILWDNTATMENSIYQTGSTLEVRYSDVQGDDVWPGEGNLNCTPTFLADGCHLDVSCQLVNSGIAIIDINGIWYACPAYDIDGDVRPYATTQPEIGVDEVDFATSIGSVSDEALATFVYPNPSKSNITISSTAVQGNIQLSFFNVSGEKVLERQLTDNETNLDISALPRGVYFVRVQNENMVEVGKMVKE